MPQIDAFNFLEAIPPEDGTIVASQYGAVIMSTNTFFDTMFGDEKRKAKYYHSVMKWMENYATQQST